MNTALASEGPIMMDIAALIELGFKHTQNALAEETYLKTGYDATRPVAFYALVNERCNVKCRYCEFWRKPHYVDEMTIDEWKKALLSIKDFVGKFSISFSGGEPFIKPGFIDLLAWCHPNGISAGVTTNGSALTKRNAEKVVAARPFNVNISVDAPSAEVHDYLRGWPGLFDKLSAGIRYLVEERKRQNVSFPLMVKPTINSRNFRHLPALIEWAQTMGADTVSPQPMNRWTPETYDELWIEEAELPELEQVIDQVIKMKRAGAPVLTPEKVLLLFADHFREKKAPREVMPCRVGLRNFMIHTDGEVKLCPYDEFPAVGNVKTQSAREIWYSDLARTTRHDTVACEKLCLLTCVSQKTLMDKVKMGVQLLRGAQPREHMEQAAE
jgi:MoaA/NifB/PqqE/SkfB family radical SAM enzyme